MSTLPWTPDGRTEIGSVPAANPGGTGMQRQRDRRSAGHRAAFWVVLCLAWLPLLATAAPAARIAPDASYLPLAPQTTYLQDTAGGISVEEAARQFTDGRFAPLPDGDASFGFQTGAFWFHVAVTNQNPREQRWLLVQQYALSDHRHLRPVPRWAHHPPHRRRHLPVRAAQRALQ